MCMFWYLNPDNGECQFTDFEDLPREDALQNRIGVAFVGIQSSKDPNWNKSPDNQNKSTMMVATGAPYKWFKEFEDSTLHKRGGNYEEIKATLGQGLLDIAMDVYPQIKHHIDQVEYATPLTNNYYFGQNFGESYGMNANTERFQDPWHVAKCRARTDIPGLYLSGQDVLTPGVLPGCLSAITTASHILERNLLIDLLWIHVKNNGLKFHE